MIAHDVQRESAKLKRDHAVLSTARHRSGVPSRATRGSLLPFYRARLRPSRRNSGRASGQRCGGLFSARLTDAERCARPASEHCPLHLICSNGRWPVDADLGPLEAGGRRLPRSCTAACSAAPCRAAATSVTDRLVLADRAGQQWWQQIVSLLVLLVAASGCVLLAPRALRPCTRVRCMELRWSHAQ